MGSSNGTGLTVPLLINGRDVTTKEIFDVVSPVTGKSIWSSSCASLESAADAADAAGRAFAAWSRTKPSHRRDILLKAAFILEERSSELARYMDSETGSHPDFSEGSLVSTSVDFLRDIAGRIAGAVTGHVPVSARKDMSAILLREPYGVILSIAPWNAPYILGIRAVAYAIAAGNTCVLKGSEVSPRCFWAIGSVFRDAGLPQGVLNVIYHRREDATEITRALIRHPAVKKINFTGSTAVGRVIAEQAGQVLKPCLMELGGKASAIVLGDADLEEAAKAVAIGAFMHSGQICMSTERIIVETSVAADFARELSKTIQGMWPDGVSAKVLVNEAGVQTSLNLRNDAIEKGAQRLMEGSELNDRRGNRLSPAVLANVGKEMEIYYTESFGPTASLFEVKSESEAIQLANDTEYGLSASIFTRDLRKALELARNIESGAVHINSMTVHDEVAIPHGGIKNSGWGRFNAQAGLEEFLKYKTVTWID